MTAIASNGWGPGVVIASTGLGHGAPDMKVIASNGLEPSGFFIKVSLQAPESQDLILAVVCSYKVSPYWSFFGVISLGDGIHWYWVDSLISGFCFGATWTFFSTFLPLRCELASSAALSKLDELIAHLKRIWNPDKDFKIIWKHD